MKTYLFVNERVFKWLMKRFKDKQKPAIKQCIIWDQPLNHKQMINLYQNKLIILNQIKKLRFLSDKSKKLNNKNPLTPYQTADLLKNIVYSRMKTYVQDSHHEAFRSQPSNFKLEETFQESHLNPQLHQVQQDILISLQVDFKINEIIINSEESLHTICLSTTKDQNSQKYIYMSHGFGGSSLMYFPIIRSLLQYGNVILWQLRGMGFSRKLKKYSVTLSQTEHFFIYPIELMLKFYCHHQNISFIGHSLGAYLIIIYLIKYNTFHDRIKEIILFSPVGITSKQQDYKSKIKSLSDCFHLIGNKISWAFGLTYKSPFRFICSCLKQKVFSSAVKGCGFTQKEQELMKDLLIAMVQLSDGSQNVFFNYFEPRVVPKYAIQNIFDKSIPRKIKIFYGGQQDWVDKTGASRLQVRYPQKVEVNIIKECGHNFPFSPQIMKRVLQEILVNEDKRNLGQKIKSQKEQKIKDLMNHQNHQNRK